MFKILYKNQDCNPILVSDIKCYLSEVIIDIMAINKYFEDQDWYDC